MPGRDPAGWALPPLAAAALVVRAGGGGGITKRLSTPKKIQKIRYGPCLLREAIKTY